MKIDKIIIFCLLITNVLSAQKYVSRTAITKFEASVPAFEEIAATNNATSCLFDSESGDLAVLALIKGFRFKVPLMEEHFNENYINSEKYPKATFKGKIINYKKASVNSKAKEFNVEGELTINGVTKKEMVKVLLSELNGVIAIKSDFNVLPADYNIKIPGIVKNKIANNVSVNFNAKLNKK